MWVRRTVGMEAGLGGEIDPHVEGKPRQILPDELGGPPILRNRTRPPVRIVPVVYVLVAAPLLAVLAQQALAESLQALSQGPARLAHRAAVELSARRAAGRDG